MHPRALALEVEQPEAPAVARAPPSLPYRIGHGFDLHRLEEGPYKLILGGLEIPHDRGCVAHSDGKRALVTPLYSRPAVGDACNVLLQE